MPRIEQVLLVNREAQNSDTAVYRKDLPKNGAYTAIDVGIRITNGSTSCVNKDLLTIIKNLSLVFNGNDYRFHMSGHAAYRRWWVFNGKPMFNNFTEAGSGVQEVWFRIQLGRWFGDEMFGLDTSRFDSVQLQVDYDATLWGSAGSTTFATGTFSVTVVLHQFPMTAKPSFRGMIGARKFYTGTSAASGDLVQLLPSARPLVALGVMAIKDNTAEASVVTDVKVGRNGFSTVWLNQKWYNLKSIHREKLTVMEEVYQLLLTSSNNRLTHLADITNVLLTPLAATEGVV